MCISCSRRQFLSRSAACAGCLAAGPLLAGSAFASEGKKPKIRVVFCETTNDKPIWPNIGYDFDARRQQLTKALVEGCPELELLFTKVMDNPKHADDVLKGDAEVDGYLICVQGLGWANDIGKLSATGKPSLVTDNLFGGSGLFLTRLPAIMRSGKPVDWVSSANDRDIVASLRCFAKLKEGKSGAEVVAAARAARRANTPALSDWACKEDKIAAPNFDEALRRFKETRLLVVGGGWGGDAFRKAAAEVTGVQIKEIGFPELGAACAAADREAAKGLAQGWIAAAEKLVEPQPDEVERSAAMYLGMKKLVEQHSARGISINCLGGFYGGHIKAYPCLGFAQLNNDGLVGGCEADQMSALTMAMMGVLVGRPGLISDPVIDTSRNVIVYAHCVGMTRAFGPQGPANPFRIRTHSEDRKGAAIQSLLPAGYMTTTMEIDPVSRKVILHRAKSVGNNPSDMACRTKLEAVVKGDLEKLTENWRMGWHRVTFYGDLKDCVTELAARLKLEVIEEA